MVAIQKNIVSSYIIIACFLVFIDFFFPAAVFAYFIKYLTTLSLFMISLLHKKRFREQKLMFVAQFFVVIADYFFVLSRGFNAGQLTYFNKLIGTFCFFLAYIILIKAWGERRNNNIRFNMLEIFIGLAVLLVLWPTVKLLAPHLNLFVKLGALSFGVILCLLVWTGLCTRFRNYYGRTTSSLIGLASCLIFVSDLAVAHASLNPIYSGHFLSWLSALIWITYVPAWAIIVNVIINQNIYF